MPSHRVTEQWLDETVETLEDLLRPGLRAVCVGINPSRLSVEAGHYYRGPAGRRFLARLHDARLIPEFGTGREDDAAFADGVGFTDVVKRPTRSAKELSAEDYAHGRDRLMEKLERCAPRLVVFTYKTAAQSIFGPVRDHGFQTELSVGTSEVFVMPGPYERVERRERALVALGSWVAKS